MKKLFIIALFIVISGSFITLSAQTTAPAFLSEQPPEIITDEYIESHFYDRPPEVEFNSFKYGLNGRKLYVSALKGRDSNPGMEKAPFLTIQKAINIVAPVDTIYVMEGTYTGGEYDTIANFVDKHGNQQHGMIFQKSHTML
jgi:hypothetical protein